MHASNNYGPVGKRGEKEVDLWATEADLSTISSAGNDVDGWDFLFSWPLRTARTAGPPPSGAGGIHFSHLPLDREPGPIRYFVQVKSTDRRLKEWPVKVSNWLKLVQIPVPAFYLVMEYDGNPRCQRAYLVHVDGAHIHAVLKRVRELEARGQEGKLHVYKHPLTWGKPHALDSLDGVALRSRIETLVGPDLDAYVAAKARLRHSVGYEEGGKRLSGRVRVPAEWAGDPRDLLLDFMLGLVRNLEVTDVEVRDTRFGSDAPEPELRAALGQLGSQGVAPFGRAAAGLEGTAPGAPADGPARVAVQAAAAPCGCAGRSATPR